MTAALEGRSWGYFGQVASWAAFWGLSHPYCSSWQCVWLMRGKRIPFRCIRKVRPKALGNLTGRWLGKWFLVINFHVGAENWTWVLWKGSPVLLTAVPSLQPIRFSLNCLKSSCLFPVVSNLCWTLGFCLCFNVTCHFCYKITDSFSLRPGVEAFGIIPALQDEMRPRVFCRLKASQG